jgi:hypothetical protein
VEQIYKVLRFFCAEPIEVDGWAIEQPLKQKVAVDGRRCRFFFGTVWQTE